MSIDMDHRQIAGEMELYFFDEQIGSGLPVWLPRGVAIREELEGFLRECERRRGYLRVQSPHLARSELYERSGHLACFRNNMFPPMRDSENQAELFLRPMNCPHHHRVFASAPRSYRQLPLRIAEFGQVYRRENSGSLHGLSRVRGLCQNDAHIYVARSQVAGELEAVLQLQEHCCRALGLSGYRYRLSKRDPAASNGDLLQWDHCEELLRQALEKLGLPYFEASGEAAFYGPKIDLQIPLAGREESVASVQLDFQAAGRFGLAFINEAGEREEPMVIHRAPIGSVERMVALLLERYEGRFPAWLAPVQLFVIPVGEEHAPFAQEAVRELIHCGIRAEADRSVGSLAKRIRQAHRARPFAKLIVGEREVAGGPLKLQLRGEEVPLERCNLADVMRRLVAGRPSP
ncbi:MAG: threonine--tRNA ligase [Bdellovibrionota bacterium]